MQPNLVGELSTLYPSGITERNIWERAGGELSDFNLNRSGKEQWFAAIKYLKNGGGRDVNLPKLIAEVKYDFPNSSIFTATIQNTTDGVTLSKNTVKDATVSAGHNLQIGDIINHIHLYPKGKKENE